MNTQLQLVQKFGNPMLPAQRKDFESRFMRVWEAPDFIRQNIPLIPPRIYMNIHMHASFTNVLIQLIERGLHKEIKSFDGCFNVRYMRGSKTMLSRHSWGLAVDMNAAWNPLIRISEPARRADLRKKHVQWTEHFLQVWRNNGFICGADWMKSIDGMHFEFPVPV